MSIDIVGMPKTYIRIPILPKLSRLQKATLALKGCILSPVYWLLAHRYHVPGLSFQRYCSLLGIRMLYARKEYVPYSKLYHLLFGLTDSTRYFEFDFMWRSLMSVQVIGRYLDISSPRQFPLVLLDKRRELTVELVNPDINDLAITANLVNAAGFVDRCHLHNCLVEAAPFGVESFDVITSISVVEHIPRDTQAVRKMWDLLKPGGRLLLSLPCAAMPSEQYLDTNLYALLEADGDGFVFFQRFYDWQMLEERIFRITGRPSSHLIYGERQAGSFRRNADRKLADPKYPFWREPYMMGLEYRYFSAIDELPGEGVIAVEFVKP